MSEQLSSEEIRSAILKTIKFANRILEGMDLVYPDKESLDPSKVFDGPILDLNDKTLTDQEKTFVQSWLEKQLGSRPEEAPIKAVYKSPDNKTTVTIYDVPLGLGEVLWYLSKWQSEGEEPSYILWSEEFYQAQVKESDYREIVK